MKKVLVTGATGFIGHYVVEELLRKDYTVIATSPNKEKAVLQPWFHRVIYIDFDLKDFDNNINYFGYFNNPEILIHLAWEGLPNYKQDFHIEQNLPRHFNFLNNLLQNGLKDINVAGTCLEYGMEEGCLSENMECHPGNPYAIAKNELRRKLEELSGKMNFNFKWVRLFYIYGKGQSANSLFSQLDKALADNKEVFNMSGGKQLRDYLPVEKAAEYIVSIAIQQKGTGIINCCSGRPVSILEMVQAYIRRQNKTIKLNLGVFPYPDYEPIEFWGDNKKIQKIIKMNNNPIQDFIDEKKERIQSFASNKSLQEAASKFNLESNRSQYSYNFSWMGRPIIQYPQDMIAMQEIIWDLKPDLIIETGIAHGGSLIFYASLLELIGKGEVLGIDIDIREYNRKEIENHPMYRRISMIEGSAISEDIMIQVKDKSVAKETVLVVLDSNHTHEHVLSELRLYSPLVSVNSYIVVFDTIVEDLPSDYLPGGRLWNPGNNPKTAVWEFLKSNDNFITDYSIDNKLLVSVAPNGYLKRIK